MIKLMFIFPYPMERQLQRVFSAFPFPEKITYKSIVKNYWDLENYEQNWRCDALIARGYTADVLESRNRPAAPVYKLDFTSGDAVAAVLRCRDLFRPKTIAVVCHPTLSIAAEMLGKVSGIPIRVYPLHSSGPYSEIDEVVERAARDGCDAFVGGGTCHRVATARRFNSILVESDDRAVHETVDRAVRMTIIRRMESRIRHAPRPGGGGLPTRYRFDDIVHGGACMREIIQTAKRFAAVDSNVLLEGETGTGKEMFAQSIHAGSPRAGQPFVAVNCTVLPEQLLESELFGYSPGAFTGASKTGKKGLFELAHGGTLFLDEISEIPYSFQGKLLRVLQEREIRRIGDNKTIPVDVRIVAATNRNLLEMAEKGTFRKDLYFRLDILDIRLPPLRRRREDIVPLFLGFLDEFSEKFTRPSPPLSPADRRLLENHPWTGNIRELRNIAERLIVLWDRETGPAAPVLARILFRPAPEPQSSAQPEPSPEPFAEQEKRRILAALAAAPTRAAAAKSLGISRSTLWRKLQSRSPDSA